MGSWEVSLSYKEAIAMHPCKPLWFCSHWWGEAISDFVRCADEHARLHCLGENQATYWICAYANNQHELSNEIGMDPLQSSFRRAMQLAKGVLLVLDSKATPFDRIWCDFEMWLALTDGTPLDIVTAPSDSIAGAHLLSQSILEGETAYTKARREQLFPLDLLVTGMHADLQNGKCSVAEDKRCILECMAIKESGIKDDQEALDRALKRANACLHAYLANVAWPQVCRKGLVEEYRCRIY